MYSQKMNLIWISHREQSHPAAAALGCWAVRGGGGVGGGGNGHLQATATAGECRPWRRFLLSLATQPNHGGGRYVVADFGGQCATRQVRNSCLMWIWYQLSSFSILFLLFEGDSFILLLYFFSIVSALWSFKCRTLIFLQQSTVYDNKYYFIAEL